MKALALDYRGILIHADRAAWFNAIANTPNFLYIQVNKVV